MAEANSIRACRCCGKSFTVQRIGRGKGLARYCSTECRKQVNRGRADKYRQMERGRCSVAGCERPLKASELCAAHYARQRRHGAALATRGCRKCGAEFVPPPNCKRGRRFYCSDACVESFKRARWCAQAHGRRMVERQGDRIDPFEVFERDGWRCRICGQDTPRELRGTSEDAAPELDHIVALSRGGTHVWGNVQCTCRRCNRDKAALPLEVYLGGMAA